MPQSVAHRERFSVVREYRGHGIGQIYPRRAPGAALRDSAARAWWLEEGMVFTHRAHDQRHSVTRRSWLMAGPWSPATARSSCPVREHMVAVTADGISEVLTPPV